MGTKNIEGLVAAGFTPFKENGSVFLEQIPKLVEYIIAQGCTAIYVCGSTGEGPLLTHDERKAVAEAYITATEKRVPVFVQVGHNSIEESVELAIHAASVGADFISACAPSYFRPNTVSSLVACMAQIAGAAPDLPFYYYHIPRLTGADLDMVEFLRQSDSAIPSLAGIKYSDLKLFEFQACQAFEQGRYDILWGCDEMLLAALATGAKGAVGSTYNFAAPVYQQVIDYYQRGEMANAQAAMFRAVELVNLLNGRHGPIHSCMKSLMGMLGLDCGGCRLPMGAISSEAAAALKTDLTALGFFDWIATVSAD